MAARQPVRVDDALGGGRVGFAFIHQDQVVAVQRGQEAALAVQGGGQGGGGFGQGQGVNMGGADEGQAAGGEGIGNQVGVFAHVAQGGQAR